jgi:hypothetical protein
VTFGGVGLYFPELLGRGDRGRVQLLLVSVLVLGDLQLGLLIEDSSQYCMLGEGDVSLIAHVAALIVGRLLGIGHELGLAAGLLIHFQVPVEVPGCDIALLILHVDILAVEHVNS